MRASDEVALLPIAHLLTWHIRRRALDASRRALSDSHPSAARCNPSPEAHRSWNRGEHLWGYVRPTHRGPGTMRPKSRAMRRICNRDWRATDREWRWSRWLG